MSDKLDNLVLEHPCALRGGQDRLELGDHEVGAC